MKKFVLPLLSVGVLLAGGAAAVRGQSALDGFDPNANGVVRVVVVQPDGKILIGGDFTTLSPNGGVAVTRNRIARLNPDGTLDTAFNPNANNIVRAIAVQADGKILVAGDFNDQNSGAISIGGQTRNRIARLDTTTGLADSFNPNANREVDSIAVQADGKILAGGVFFVIGGQTRNFIARLDATTGLADSFNPNADFVVVSFAVQADGKILAAGSFSFIGGQPRNRIARLDATTGLADSFNPNANSGVLSIVLQADGKILAAGGFTTIGGQTRPFIARLDATTGLADSFNPNVSSGVNSIAVQADGKVLAGGFFGNINGQPRNNIARLDATTGLADSFNPNANSGVRSIALQADGKILAGGDFTQFAPNGAAAVTRNRIARLIAVPTPTPTPTSTPTPTPPVITSPLIATGTVGLPFSYQFEASGATSLAASNLPPGLTFNTSLRAITGLPTTAGIFPVGLSATNSAGTTNATLTITVQPAPISGPVIISSTCATGRTGRPFSFQLQASGGSSATRFTVGGLPPGLNLDPATGFISGTPTPDGSFSLAVSAIDGAATTQATLQLTFTSDPTVPIITSPGTAILTPGQFFSYTITADANGTFGYIGTDGIVHQGPTPTCAGLPAGLCFNGVDTISGTFTGGPINGVRTEAADRNANGGPRRISGLAGGIVTNVQLFATDPSGTGTFPLINFIAARGTVQISTRMAVGAGDNVLIGGFILAGTGTTRALIRAIGPSLTPLGVPNALQDPILELRDGAGSLLGSNDNWRDSQRIPIEATGIPPTNDLESAILAFLSPGPYTAIVRGNNNTTGIALVEVYDLGIAAPIPPDNARLANISTRGTVLGGDNVMIGGFIIRPPAPATSTRVVIRAIGPSLPLPGALADPTLSLHDGNGTLIVSNDNWRTGGQEAEIIATTIPPTNDFESAIVRDLTPGNYTAIVRGNDNTTGVALVEVYALE